MLKFSFTLSCSKNSQSLYSFTFTAVIVIHEYIYSHSTTKFTFKKYICLHLTTYFLFTNIFTHIYGMYHSHSPAYIRSHSRSKYSFNTVQYSFNIFCALSLRIDRSQLPASPPEDSVTSVINRTFQENNCPSICNKLFGDQPQNNYALLEKTTAQQILEFPGPTREILSLIRSR